jgi:succinate dehydrogenase / fumarate reductase iron-sulfur subunit
MLDVAGAMSCIMCGACVSDCTVLEVDQRFLGPAALAKAYRFVEDPRDASDGDRLKVLSEYGGVWDCTRCNYCVEVCPKGVAPMDRILALRRKAIEDGLVDTLGARHVIEFEETTRQRSWLAQM